MALEARLFLGDTYQMYTSSFFRRGWIALNLIALLSSSSAGAQSPWPAGSGIEIASGIQSLVPGFEASGLIYHPLSAQILVVSDEGHVCKMDVDGSQASCFNLGSHDFEGITLASPNSGFAYLAEEFPYKILELDVAAEQLSGKSWDVPGIDGPTNAGIEAIAFVPNGSHPYADSSSGGLFYLGHQDTGEILVYDVDLAQPGLISLVDRFTPFPGRTDLADFFFHEESGILFALYDSANVLSEMQSDGTILREYIAAGIDQEGILFLGNCSQGSGTIYIAEDSGPSGGAQVLAFEGYPLNCPAPDPGDGGGDGEEPTEENPGDGSNGGTEAGHEAPGEEKAEESLGSGGCSLIIRDDKAGPSKSYKRDTTAPRK